MGFFIEKATCGKCGGEAVMPGRIPRLVAGPGCIAMAIVTPIVIASNGTLHLLHLVISGLILALGIATLVGSLVIKPKYTCRQCKSTFNP